MDKRFTKDFLRGSPSPLPRLREIARENVGAMRTSDFAEDGRGLFSLEAPQRLFTFDGSLRTNRLQPPPVYRDFFEYPGRVVRERGETVLRGPRYLCALDNNIAFAHKLKIFKTDFGMALDTLIHDSEPEKSKTHRIYRLAALDYLKNSTVTLLNALISPEKFGGFNFEDKGYQRARRGAISLVELSTHAQYAFMAGDGKRSQEALAELSISRTLIEEVSLELLRMATATVENMGNGSNRPIINRPELSHPGVIGGAVLRSVERLKDSPPDTIVGLPTGGTEYAYALQYGFLLQTGKKPEVVLLPISLHSTKKNLETEADIAAIAARIASGEGEEESLLHTYMERQAKHFRGRSLLIADDNASSGHTIQLAVDVFRYSFGPKHVDVSIAEVDTIRTKLRERSMPTDTKDIALSVVTEEALMDAVNVLPVSQHLQRKTDLRKLAEFKRIQRVYERKSAQTKLEQVLRAVEQRNATSFFLSEILDSQGRGTTDIYSFRGTFLSNFYPARICFSAPSSLNGRKRAPLVAYPSVEHAYQAAKFTPAVIQRISKEALTELNALMHRRYRSTEDSRRWKPIEKARDLERVFSSGEYSAGQVKVLADKLRDMGFIREDWFDIRLSIMTGLLLEKFKHPELAEALCATGDKLLVEGNTWGDNYWGVAVRSRGKNGTIGLSQIKNGFGQNILGLLLMEIRTMVQAQRAEKPATT